MNDIGRGTWKETPIFLLGPIKHIFFPKSYIWLEGTESLTQRILEFTALTLRVGMLPLGPGIQRLYETVYPKNPTQLFSTCFLSIDSF